MILMSIAFSFEAFALDKIGKNMTVVSNKFAQDLRVGRSIVGIQEIITE